MYSELFCRPNYGFLTGASHPEELVARAAELGLSALALTDDDGLYGVVKAHLEAKARGLKLLVASSLTLTWGGKEGPRLVVYVEDKQGSPTSVSSSRRAASAGGPRTWKDATTKRSTTDRGKLC